MRMRLVHVMRAMRVMHLMRVVPLVLAACAAFWVSPVVGQTWGVVSTATTQASGKTLIFALRDMTLAAVTVAYAIARGRGTDTEPAMRRVS